MLTETNVKNIRRVWADHAIRKENCGAVKVDSAGAVSSRTSVDARRRPLPYLCLQLMHLPSKAGADRCFRDCGTAGELTD